MAHYAELDENNVVIRVIPGVDEKEKDGESIYRSISGKIWKRTSYNTSQGKHLLGGVPYRKNYAGINYFYDEIRDAFIPPKSDNIKSWILSEESCTWISPIPYPNDNKSYIWDENTISWKEFIIPTP